MRFACLLTDGFEDMEALGTVALLRRSGIVVDFVGVYDQIVVKGSFQTEVMVTTMMKKISVDDYDGLFIPGGRQAAILREEPKVLELVQAFHEKNKWMMAICAGPTVFGKIGLLDGKHYISFPGTEIGMGKGIRVNAPAVTDGKFITAIGAGAIYEFALEIIEKTLGIEKRNELAKKIYFRTFETEK